MQWLAVRALGSRMRAAPLVARGLRGFSSASSPTTAKYPSMDQPFEGIPALKPARNLPKPTTEVTTLSNGLRVASEETYGQVFTVAGVLDFGSAFESDEHKGVCHFLEALGFQSTQQRTADKIQRDLQAHGLTTHVGSNREVIMYKVDGLRGSLEQAVELLAETLTQPLFTPEEIERARMIVEYQQMDQMENLQLLIQEHLHVSAFGATSRLGRPHLCPIPQIPKITKSALEEYMGAYYNAPRMVLSGAGVNHQELVELADKYFAHMPTKPTSSLLEPVESVESPYVGGDYRVATPESPMLAMLPPTTHIALAFPTVGWVDEDVIPVCVLDTLLGGGSSFSAGGPGKGMYSRLYREVLNAYGWVDSANAFSLQFTHQGLLGLYGSCAPQDALNLVNIFCNQITKLALKKVSEEELSRARNQLRSSVMMNLEIRSILCEDIGRQILNLNKRLDPVDLCEKIDKVTADDLQRIVFTALKHRPSFAVVGDASSLPQYRDIEAYFTHLRNQL